MAIFKPVEHLFLFYLQLYTYDFDEPQSSGDSSLQTNYLYHNNQLVPFCSAASCPDLWEAIKLIDKIDSLDLHSRLQHNHKDMSMRTFLREDGASEGAIAIVQSICVQEMSSKMDDCSVYEACRLSNAWHVGKDNYRFILACHTGLSFWPLVNVVCYLCLELGAHLLY